MAPVTVTRTRAWWGFHHRILIEVDGKRVGGVWNGRDLKFDVPTGPHTFRAFMGWIGSKPLEVEVRESGETVLGVRAPWQEAATSAGLYRPMGPMARGVGRYTKGQPDAGLDIWEQQGSSDQLDMASTVVLEQESTMRTAAQRRRVLGIWALLAVYLASVAAGPLIAHAAGARGDIVFFSGMAGPMAIYPIVVAVAFVHSFVSLRRDSRQSPK